MVHKAKRKNVYDNNPGLRAFRVSHGRTIKPELYEHEGLAELPVHVRYFFIGLTTCCDKHGRFEWSPKFLKLRIYPFDDYNVAEILDALIPGDFVQPYEIDGKKYGTMPGFPRHQSINLREKQSRFEYPAPPKNVQAPVTHMPARAMSEEVGLGMGMGVGVEERKNSLPESGADSFSQVDEVSEGIYTITQGHAPDRKDIRQFLSEGHSVETILKAFDWFHNGADGERPSIIVRKFFKEGGFRMALADLRAARASRTKA